MTSKVTALEDLPALIPEGASVALGGAWFANHPMAAVRQLVRARRTDIHAIALLGSVDVDLLVGAGVLSRLMFSMVTLEAFGLAPNFRRAVERGQLPIQEMTALALEVAIEAGGRKVPFLPLPGPYGSDIPKLHPDLYGLVQSPFGDSDVMAVRAIRPDVAIVHALRCSEDGTAQFDGTFAMDPELAKAATAVIVTCEELVTRADIEASPHMTQIPGFVVDAVTLAPFGAHPCSHVPRYAVDAWQLAEYAEAAADPEVFARYVDNIRSETEDLYRARVLAGGRDRVLRALIDAGPVLVEG